MSSRGELSGPGRESIPTPVPFRAAIRFLEEQDRIQRRASAVKKQIITETAVVGKVAATIWTRVGEKGEDYFIDFNFVDW